MANNKSVQNVNAKKKPERTLMEKRAAKKAKNTSKSTPLIPPKSH